TLWRTTAAEIILGSGFRAGAGDDVTIGGSVEQLVDTFGRYAAAGLDEFIVMDGNLGLDPARSIELFDLMAHDVFPRVG
ncbi:MAG TPA: hypothetical protein VFJ22_03220, partial [Dermatophilaceae bacterium]|nr:hypothetical protein [Dermatophilaceae bacterium]